MSAGSCQLTILLEHVRRRWRHCTLAKTSIIYRPGVWNVSLVKRYVPLAWVSGHIDGVPDTRSTLGSLVPCCPAADGIAHTLLYTDGSRAYCACIHEIRQ